MRNISVRRRGVISGIIEEFVLAIFDDVGTDGRIMLAFQNRAPKCCFFQECQQLIVSVDGLMKRELKLSMARVTKHVQRLA